MQLNEMTPPSVSEETLIDEEYRELVSDYAQVQYLYNAAIQFMNVRLETLTNEFRINHRNNPIHHIRSRVKSPASIAWKLRKQGIPVSMTNAKKSLHDLAGVRVVCCYIDDIFTIANMIRSQDDIQVITEKNYIENPKTNGYRSLHLVVDVPVYLSSVKLFVPVEVQIRTVAMDFWASLEHNLRYKAASEVPPEIVAELKHCADIITETDLRMENISKKMNQLQDVDGPASDLGQIHPNH